MILALVLASKVTIAFWQKYEDPSESLGAIITKFEATSYLLQNDMLDRVHRSSSSSIKKLLVVW